MNSKMIFGIVVGAVVLIAVALFGLRASAISLDEGKNTAWGNYQASIQRRNDLVPNLVETVKGYAAHEQETLLAVTEARNQFAKIDMKGAADNREIQKRIIEANKQLSSAMSRLMVVVEKYPDLKANQNFLDLQRQLEGTENRVNQTRRLFNEAVKGYNSFIRTWGFCISSSFKQAQYFEAEPGSEKAPKINFGK